MLWQCYGHGWKAKKVFNSIPEGGEESQGQADAANDQVEFEVVGGFGEFACVCFEFFHLIFERGQFFFSVLDDVIQGGHVRLGVLAEAGTGDAFDF